MALGRRAFTHDRIQDVDSIMFPKILLIGGKPLDHSDKSLWGKEGWKHKNSSQINQDGVGGVAGIWHSDKAGKDQFIYNISSFFIIIVVSIFINLSLTIYLLIINFYISTF